MLGRKVLLAQGEEPVRGMVSSACLYGRVSWLPGAKPGRREGSAMESKGRRLRGADHVASMKSRGMRCLPRSSSDMYLDIYVLRKEEERMQKQLAQFTEMADKAALRLKEVGERIAMLEEHQREARDGTEEVAPKTPPKKEWKVMHLGY